MWKTFALIFVCGQIRGEENPNKIQELVGTLLKDYHSEASPHNEHGTIGNVSFGIAPICLHYDLYHELEGLVWYKMSWHDNRLKWDPENGIHSLSIPHEKVWIPDVVPYFGEETIHKHMPVLIFPDGKVLFIAKVNIKYYCYGSNPNKHSNEITCPLKMGSWTHDAESMNLDFFDGKEEVILRYYANSQCPVKLLHSKAKKVHYDYDSHHGKYMALDFNLNFLVHEEEKHEKSGYEFHQKRGHHY